MSLSDNNSKPKRLRPWLEGMLDRGETTGLRWTDPAKTMFQIPWKHRGKQDWSPEHSRIFKEWAIQTGRFREGIDQEDYPTWKTRLRCAFNKAPDMEEMRELRRQDSAEPYRVYRFKPVSTTVPSESSMFAGKNNRQQELASADEFSTLCKKIKFDENSDSFPFVTAAETATKYHLQQHDASYRQSSASGLDQTAAVKQEISPEDFTSPVFTDVTDSELVLTVRYCGQQVLERSVTNPAGCVIHYNPTDLSDDFNTQFSDNVETIALPPPGECNLNLVDKQRSLIDDLLRRGMERGLFLKCIGSNIHAHRSCQCATFYYDKMASSSLPGYSSIKLRRTEADRTEMVCVFDYSRYVAALRECLDIGEMNIDVGCTFVFGQDVPFDNRFDFNVLISVTVATRRALNDVIKANNALAIRRSMHKIQPPNLLTSVNAFDMNSALT